MKKLFEDSKSSSLAYSIMGLIYLPFLIAMIIDTYSANAICFAGGIISIFVSICIWVDTIKNWNNLPNR